MSYVVLLELQKLFSAEIGGITGTLLLPEM